MTRQLPAKVRVQVTRNMIHWAVTQRSTQCAVALAIRDADPDGLFERPWVTQDRIAFTDRYTDQRYEWDADQIPDKIKTWIDQFDRDPGKCRPFSFTLEIASARVTRLVHKTRAEQSIHQRTHNRNFEAKHPSRRQYEEEKAAAVVERRQAKIPAAQRDGIVHTSKRELRPVVVPDDAGIIR